MSDLGAYMLRLLAPPPQSAEAAILTICDRLENSTMLEDRCSAILGLRGFATDHRETVAANGMRGLLSALVKDTKFDQELRRACLETLVNLFGTPRIAKQRVKHKRYLSPLLTTRQVDDISRWLADQSFQNEDVLSSLCDIARDIGDPYSSMYALQLISAMAAARPDRAAEAVIAEPTGAATLVGSLGSESEMVRHEGVVLLLNLTIGHSDLQKLVAFEGAFDKLWDIIENEGGIFGGVMVEECLSLLARLLEYNVANQVMFVESDSPRKLEDLLADGEIEYWGASQTETNVCASLELLSLCVTGPDTQKHNQTRLRPALLPALKLAFGSSTPVQVRTTSLRAVASLIYQNPELQSEVLAIDVPWYDLTLARVVGPPPVLPCSQALAGWAVKLGLTHLFELRAASLVALDAGINDSHDMQFTSEQIESLGSGEGILSVLADPSEEDDARLDPYRIWFAAAIVMNIISRNVEAKDRLTEISVGDESLGQERHLLIQAVAGQLQYYLSQPVSAALIGYLQLFTVWLWDSTSAASAFVAESSTIQSLIAFVVGGGGSNGPAGSLASSLAAVVLGVAYLFCPPDAPLARSELWKILTTALGQDQYQLHIRRLAKNPEFHDFDVEDMFAPPRDVDDGMPRIFFESSFVDLMQQQLSRVQRALEKDPTIEPAARISLEDFDQLQALNLELSNSVESLKTELSESKKQYESLNEQFQTVTNEKSAIDSLRPKYDSLRSETDQLKEKFDKTTQEFEELREKHRELQESYDKASHESISVTRARTKAEEGVNKLAREVFELTKQEEQSRKRCDQLTKSLKQLEAKLEKSQNLNDALKSQVEKAVKEAKDSSKSRDDALSKANTALAEAETAKKMIEQALEERRHLTESIKKQSKQLQDAESCTASINDLEKKLENAKKEAAEAKAAAAKSQDNAATEKDVEKAKKIASQALADKLKFKEDVDYYREKSVSAEKAKAEKETELDELLVLIDGLTEQKNQYKNRLKKYEEVSDSEDEDEEE